MYYSPIIPSPLLSKDKVYIKLDQEGWCWVTFHNSVTALDYENFPTKRATSFLLLSDFKGGADGRVWLACSTSGKVCVIKFYNHGHTLKDIKLAHSIWQTVWKKQARIVTLTRKNALLMPYVCILDEHERNEEHTVAAKAAVDEMVKYGFSHPDLSWRHVGFYRTGQELKLHAVFIDLIRCTQFDPTNTLESTKAQNFMLTQLNLPIHTTVEFPEVLSPYKPRKKGSGKKY
jgi:hypothetical protein